MVKRPGWLALPPAAAASGVSVSVCGVWAGQGEEQQQPQSLSGLKRAADDAVDDEGGDKAAEAHGTLC